MPPTNRPRGSLVAAMNWMGGLSLLLFWLPGLGPLVAGAVGGSKAGSIGRAAVAVFLPAILTGILAAVGVTYLTRWEPWGILAALGGLALSLLNVGPLFVGAMIGGLAAEISWRRSAR